jgi:hypothetical protein
MAGPLMAGGENFSDARTDLIPGRDYWQDVVLRVLVDYDFIQKNGQWIDGIRCRGSREHHVTQTISGSEQLVRHSQAGNGVIGIGLNGVVGYVHGLEHAGFIGRGQDGVIGISSTNDRSGVSGFNTQREGPSWGVFGRCDSPEGAGVGAVCEVGVGVRGESSGNDGVVGISASSNRSGVFGFSSLREGRGFGVVGRCHSSNGAGVLGENEAAGDGVAGVSRNGAGVSGTSRKKDGVVGRAVVAGASGVYGENTRDPYHDDIDRTGRSETFRQPVDWSIFGVMGRANSSVGTGVKGVSNEGDGMSGTGGRYGAVLDGRVAPLRLSPAPAPGAPSSGYDLMGELLLDSHGDLFLCKASGTPGVWKQIA